MSRAAADPHADQVAAAEAEAAASLPRYQDVLGGSAPVHINTPDWVAAILTRHNAVAQSGRGVVCAHGGAPRVFHVAAWRPGWQACARCAADGMLLAGLTEVEQITCDRCQGRFGYRPPVSLMQTGMFMLWVALCHGCRADLPAPPR